MSVSVPRVSVVEQVDTLIMHAITQGASDIHLQTCKDGLRIRLRIDGVLYDQEIIPSDLMHQVVARIKVLANIDIAQQRIPQDGKFQIPFQDRTIDIRVSTFPSLFGQNIALRILDQDKEVVTIENLGMSSAMQEQFKRIITQPQGLFLVTGPTGSGKTTTLYAALLHINSPEKNIITLEDPIEYYIQGLTQGHIHPEAGFTFEKGMRHMLRQDPDVIMIGEVRDAQTASIVMQAAMTGHLVLSTLHTNDAPTAVMRLMDIGVEPFLITASLSGVLAQRLARTLCSCKRARPVSAQEAKFLASNGVTCTTLYEPVGCDSCMHIGYKGRTGIFQLLPITDAMRAALSVSQELDHIRTQAQAVGMGSLLQDGLHKVQQGTISLQDLLRIIP
jgi:type II secretory ATPase GspE/PulE/Tfp pilus assembly ATPase PilB-like protein